MAYDLEIGNGWIRGRVDLERISKISEKLVRSRLYISDSEYVDSLVGFIAKDMGLKLKRVTERDLKRIEEILSKGESLSQIVLQSREPS
ncbi:MAG: hypothetical protein ACE5GD_05705 [Candidatus Geothermarchaeales archaeon]